MNQGRVNLNNKPQAPFELFQNNYNDDTSNFSESIKSIQTDSKLSQLFFSRDNINTIHISLINTVFMVSNGQYKIGKQSELQLQIIMRSIFLQEAKHLLCNYNQQIQELNQKVIDFGVPKIISEIKQYIGYKRDVNNLPKPLEHPKNLSNKGYKILTSKIGFN